MQLFRTVMEGLVAPAVVRWHDDAIWLSDLHDHRVLRIDLDHQTVVPVTFLAGDRPSGIGFLPDGRMLVAAMSSRLVLRLEPGGVLVPHAHLAAVATGDLDDLVVRADGVAFVSDLGMRRDDAGARRHGGRVFRIDPDGSVELAADELEAPAGLVLSADERELTVSESAARRLSTYDVDPRGRLSRRRTFAELVPGRPDLYDASPTGICGDADGGVWCADPLARSVVRIVHGGEVTHSFPTGHDVAPQACALTGPGGRTLVIAVGAGGPPTSVRRSGRLLAVELDLVGAANS